MDIGEMDVKIARNKWAQNMVNVKCKYLHSIRWDTKCGGIGISAGEYGLYGNILCTNAKGIDHSGIHIGINGTRNCPHDIKVYIFKKYNPSIYGELSKMAGERPKESWRDGINVMDEVREEVRKNPGITGVEVQNILEQKGIHRERTQKAIRRLKKGKFKKKEGLSSEKYKNTQKLILRPPS